MCRISIALASPSTEPVLLKFLHQRLGLSLLTARGHLAKGPQGLFYSELLYGNDHPQRDAEIRDIIAFFDARQVPLVFFESDEQADPKEGEPLEQEVLINQLEAARGRYA
ncbi:hypothetical protein J4P02_03020 [Pseudomonas sp. NFXW11]|uniref:hypothetical protein n=1 Tax=Pseudomonas sp. NFXW11 TaxID=2819531 RepID=UPI003CEF596F